jgi:hypothetical protein
MKTSKKMIFTAIFLVLLMSCARNNSNDLVGTWKDISIDKISSYTPEQREAMRSRFILNADGTGFIFEKGVKKPLHWVDKKNWGPNKISLVELRYRSILATPDIFTGEEGMVTTRLPLSKNRRKMKYNKWMVEEYIKQ